MQKIAVNEVCSALEEILKRVNRDKHAVQISRQDEALAALVPMEDLALIQAARAQGRHDAAVDLQRANDALKKEIAERKRTEEKLKQSEARLKRAAEIASLGYYVWDLVENRCVYCSEEYARFHGMSVEEYLATSATAEADVLLVHPEDRERYQRAFDETLTRKEPMDLEYRLLARDGEVRYIHEIEGKFELVDGQPVRSEGTLQDITAFKQAQEQFHRVQRMEAIGQLSGGVAHDFNNLLAVIMGNAELLADELGKDNRSLASIIAAAQRGADLTQQLLAYSRKQTLRPQAVNVEELVHGLSVLLDRTLGESIEIERHMAPGLWRPYADPSLIESALLNLALNARDAMPDGGLMTIACDNAKQLADENPNAPEIVAGDFVCLTVSDCGLGMSAAVLERAFEPFFTTKDVGKGSGLGLSMVYGFAEQSRGHVEIESEVGRGTTVRLYLPRAARASAVDQTPTGDVSAQRREESILVIEDEDEVRRLTVRMLTDLGYSVVDVADVAGATKLITDKTPLDLVLSDVALSGGTSGPAFAASLRESHPDLKVLFMSGHPSRAGSLTGFSRPVLSKPFTRLELAEAVRTAIEAD